MKLGRKVMGDGEGESWRGGKKGLWIGPKHVICIHACIESSKKIKIQKEIHLFIFP